MLLLVEWPSRAIFDVMPIFKILLPFVMTDQYKIVYQFDFGIA